jgi:DnaK suppressor protein
MTAKSKPRQAVKATAKAAAKTVVKAKAKSKAKAPASKAEGSHSTTKTTSSSQRTEALRKMLLERRQEVMKEINGLIGHRMSDEIQRRVDSAPDVGDQALLDTERVRDISIMELRNKMRQQIDEALAKLEEGTYGRCADCGAEITEKRLRAVPFARRCVTCQEKQEMLEKIEMEEEQEL